MRIAQVAPLHESVPPRLYGGTERVVSYLTEQLVAEGHDVTLFASGDSVTSARLIPACPYSLRLDPRPRDPISAHLVMLEKVAQQAHRFDIIHFHCDYLHFSLSRRMATPSVSTLHGRLDLPDLVPVYREFSERPLISVSDAQRRPLPWANWLTTVHHGLPEDYGAFRAEVGTYLAFLGRISPEKGVERAIEIAHRTGRMIKIAAKVDRVDQPYFEQVIRPLLYHPRVEFLGEIGGREKDTFLAGARALLCPIDWPEPFGLVMIESMACGTPVVAFRRGSVPEIVENGVTGYVVDGVAAAAEAVERAGALSRQRCRDTFEERFTAPRMVSDYLSSYSRIVPHATTEPCEQASTS